MTISTRSRKRSQTADERTKGAVHESMSDFEWVPVLEVRSPVFI
jgi:hypothetical protein